MSDAPAVDVVESDDYEEEFEDQAASMKPDEFEELLLSILARHHGSTKEEIVEAFFLRVDGTYNSPQMREMLDQYLQRSLAGFREGLKQDYAEFEKKRRMTGLKKIGVATLVAGGLIGTYVWGRSNGLKIGRLEHG